MMMSLFYQFLGYLGRHETFILISKAWPFTAKRKVKTRKRQVYDYGTLSLEIFITTPIWDNFISAYEKAGGFICVLWGVLSAISVLVAVNGTQVIENKNSSMIWQGSSGKVLTMILDKYTDWNSD